MNKFKVFNSFGDLPASEAPTNEVPDLEEGFVLDENFLKSFATELAKTKAEKAKRKEEEERARAEKIRAENEAKSQRLAAVNTAQRLATVFNMIDEAIADATDKSGKIGPLPEGLKTKQGQAEAFISGLEKKGPLGKATVMLGEQLAKFLGRELAFEEFVQIVEEMEDSGFLLLDTRGYLRFYRDADGNERSYRICREVADPLGEEGVNAFKGSYDSQMKKIRDHRRNEVQDGVRRLRNVANQKIENLARCLRKGSQPPFGTYMLPCTDESGRRTTGAMLIEVGAKGISLCKEAAVGSPATAVKILTGFDIKQTPLIEWRWLVDDRWHLKGSDQLEKFVVGNLPTGPTFSADDNYRRKGKMRWFLAALLKELGILIEASKGASKEAI